MRGAVLLQRREAMQQPSAHFRVSRYLTERSLPRCAGHDCKRTPLARVVGAENHAARGDFQARIHCASHTAGVDVSRMGSDASDGGDAAGLDRSLARSLARRSVFPNVAQQFVSAARIKPAGDGRSSYSGRHQKLVWRGHSCPRKLASENYARENYEPPSRSARNNAAVLSSGSASARIAGFTPLFANAARSAPSSYRVFRLFQRVFRFCPKQSFRNAMNSASENRSDFSRGLIVIRITLECTFGGGENAPGGSVKSCSTWPYSCAVAESKP